MHAQTVQQQALLIVFPYRTVCFDTYLKWWSQCRIVLAITITEPPTTDRPALDRKQLRDVDNGRSEVLKIDRQCEDRNCVSSSVFCHLKCAIVWCRWHTRPAKLQPSKLTLTVICVELNRWIWKKASICLYSNHFMTLVGWMCSVVSKSHERF